MDDNGLWMTMVDVDDTLFTVSYNYFVIFRYWLCRNGGVTK